MLRSIKFRVFLDLLIASLVPMAIAVSLASSRSQEQLVKTSEANLQLLASVTATRLDQLIVDTQRVVSVISRDTSLRAFCEDADNRESHRSAVNAKLKSVTASAKEFASIFVVDTKGTGLASTNPKNVGMDLTFRAYVREALAGSSYVSDFLVGKTTRDPGVYFSTPVRDDAGKVIGAVVLKLQGARVWELVETLRPSGLGITFVTDEHGVIIAHPDRSLLYHSLGELPAERAKSLDPQTRYGIDVVASANAPELMNVVGNTAPGTASFTHHTVDTTPRPEPWIAGYAPMTSRPWKVFVAEPQHQFSAALLDLARQQSRIALAVAVAAGLYAIFRARQMVRPLLSLSAASKKLASGDFTARAEATTRDEVGDLATTFNEMVPKLQQSVELRRSMELAQKIQQNLLPQTPPKLARIDVFGRSQYCDETGGDYYDFADTHALGGGQTLVAVGDVTGHGLGAALLMCTARAALRAAALTEPSLGTLLTRVNTILTQDAVLDLYMTMTLMIFDSDTGRVRYACAAHDPIVVYDPQTQELRELAEGFIPLGVDDSITYDEYSADGVAHGSVIFIGTDGIWEARNPQGEMFGKDRMFDAIRVSSGGSAKDVGMAVEAALTGFLAGRKIQDDVTYVAMKYLPPA